ncbi:MAG: TetR/AcrR family transcriptional regulator [Hyphomicrobiaceae bacterium]|nr:TetR/AcrR family transcriptional regulator [Hyphomicrobiaceae bacterium]
MRMPNVELQTERRRQILRAAERCFTRSGFHGTGMQEVCLEAGMSAGNVYRYFRSKTEIIAAIIDEERQRIAAQFAALSTAESFLGALSDLIDQHLADHANREHLAMWAEVLSEISRNAEIAAVYAGLERDMRAAMTRAVERAIERGEIAPTMDPATVAVLLLSLGDGLCARAGVDIEVSLPALAEAVKQWSRLLLRPLKPPVQRETDPAPSQLVVEPAS